METKTAIESLRNHSEECIDNGQPIKVPEAMAPGDMLPQGDIGLLMLEALPHGSKPDNLCWNGDKQLAPGNTKGSRHCIPAKFESVVEIYVINDGDDLSNLVIKAKEPFDLVHPEHADHIGYPAGIYRVRHQQNAERMRVLD